MDKFDTDIDDRALARLLTDTRPVMELDVALRSYNLLMRHGYATIREAAAAAIHRQLDDLPGLGKVTLDDILAALHNAALTSSDPSVGEPPEMERFQPVEQHEVAGTVSEPLPPVVAIETLLAVLTERDRAVFQARVLSEPNAKPTLQQLGDDLGVTRERVRQIEQNANVKLQKALAHPDNTRLRNAAELLRRSGQPIAWESAIDRGALLATTEVDVTDQQWAMLVHLAEGQVEDGFLHWGILQQIRDAVQDLVAEFSGIRSEEMVEAFREELGLDHEIVIRLLAESTNEFQLPHAADTRYLVRRGATYNEFAKAIIMAAGRKVSVDEIRATMSQVRPCEDRSLRNALATDDEFVRVTKTEWTLASAVKSDQVYSGITNDVEQALSRLAPGETTSINELVKQIAKRRDVSETSVRMYATDPRFYSPQRGRIRMRTHTDPIASGTSHATDEELLARPNVIRHDGRPALQIPVDGELLRGSGRPTSNVVARYLQMQPGDTRLYPVLGGTREIAIRWRGKQPVFSSLRAIAQDLGAQLGDTLLLCFHSPTFLDVELDAPDDIRREDDGRHQAETPEDYEALHETPMASMTIHPGQAADVLASTIAAIASEPLDGEAMRNAASTGYGIGVATEIDLLGAPEHVQVRDMFATVADLPVPALVRLTAATALVAKGSLEQLPWGIGGDSDEAADTVQLILSGGHDGFITHGAGQHLEGIAIDTIRRLSRDRFEYHSAFLLGFLSAGVERFYSKVDNVGTMAYAIHQTFEVGDQLPGNLMWGVASLLNGAIAAQDAQNETGSPSEA